ncbi:cytochrome P450 [Protomyces lactucae-debilis]|uniref:Cytochrome P450 n=1 Tax=Protomyces lactucae-debilis TaxID=2754530 RepID=A0A1Y2F558_PROLT|nr:cytochrome P450 [Protomyces lactucae-debilis]ORY79022.1 cytochrome P450 [Protomyces lactucae-debilis]
MGLLASLLLSPWTYLICLAVAVPLLYLIDPLRINWVPGPLLAKVSPLWLFWQARRYRRYKAVHAAHAKYGTFVRISTDHVSIASAEAIPLVYGHGTGTLKAPYYDAFVSIHRGLFSTRDRAEHTRKRKNISHIFSHQNVREFEPYIHANLSLFLNQMSTMVTHASDQIARFDFFPWATYLSFDIIGDLAFGEPFGFIKAGKDHNDAIRILTDRGEWSATVGTMPYIKPWTPYMVWDSFFPKGLTAVKELGQIAITAVEKRLKKGSNRRDVLSFLINARDCQGNPMPDNELKAEAQTQLIAGSDTTANALTSIIDVLCRNPVEYEKLNNSIDDMMQQIGIERDDERLATLAEVQYNKELISCIWESLRIQPVSAMGLPRSVPAGGLDVCGKHFKEGTVLSVPAYTIHHDAKRFPDPYTFKPSRFIKDPPSDKEFVPFSYGPRACVGRNVALMELQTVLANLLYRFKFERQDGNKHATVFREGFILKPTELLVSMTRRC